MSFNFEPQIPATQIPASTHAGINHGTHITCTCGQTITADDLMPAYINHVNNAP